MRAPKFSLVFTFSLLSLPTCAQTGVTTAGGSAGFIAKFDGMNSIVQSHLYQDPTTQVLNFSGGFLNVQTSPGQYTLAQADGSTSPIATSGFGSLFAGDVILRSFWGVSIELNGGNFGDGGASAAQTRIPGTSSFTVNSRASDSAFQTLLTVRNNGNVGVGTVTPTAKLDVNGNVKLSGNGASITFPDNTVQSTAWNGTACGGD